MQVSSIGGTDEHVLASLFDKQALAEFEPVEIEPHYEERVGGKIQQNTIERFASKFLSQRSFRHLDSVKEQIDLAD